MKGLAVLVVLLLSVSACAQVPPPGEVLVIKVSVTERVQSLTYNAALVGPFTPDGETGSFSISFSCVGSIENLPPGWTVEDFYWGPVWAPGNPPLAFGVVSFLNEVHSYSATGLAYTAGYGYPVFNVVLRNSIGQIQPVMQATQTVAAIGGALKVMGYGEAYPSITWENDGGDEFSPFIFSILATIQWLCHKTLNIRGKEGFGLCWDNLTVLYLWPVWRGRIK